MSVLSIIKEINLGNPKSSFILPIIVFGLFYVIKSVGSEDITEQIESIRTDGIAYCDEKLIQNRELSKRYVET